MYTLAYSREKARQIVNKAYPNLNADDLHIHHIDGNPFNNNIYNLAPLPPFAHRLLHSTKDFSRKLTLKQARRIEKEKNRQAIINLQAKRKTSI